MVDFKMSCLFVFIVFSNFVFGVALPTGDPKNSDFIQQSLRDEKKDQSALNPSRIITKNRVLLRKLNKHFRKKTVSKKQIQQFLVKNSYYQSEVTKTKAGYVIKNPVQVVFVFRGNHFFNEKKSENS